MERSCMTDNMDWKPIDIGRNVYEKLKTYPNTIKENNIKKINVKAKEVALFSALSQKVRDNEVLFIDEIKVDAPKTKEMVAFLKAFNLNKSVLVVMDNADVSVLRACANIQAISTIPASQINTYDVVKNATIVISKAAVEQIKEVYGE